MLFEVKEIDRKFYEERIRGFLPQTLIDIHTHIWLDSFISEKKNISLRTVTWPGLVAKDNSIEDLLETYRLMFPGKQVTPMIFSTPQVDDNLNHGNEYVRSCAQKNSLPSLILACPRWSSDEFEEKILTGRFLGAKVYLNFSEPYIPRQEIRIFDFLPSHQLKVIDKHGWIVMLHIPRDKRLKDPVNLAQMVEIEHNYPNIKLIIAHVGRAYCSEDVGEAFTTLANTKKQNPSSI